MYQLWNSCVSSERAFVGFLRCMGEPLLILSRSSATLKKFQNELKDFQTSKGTLRFSPDRPLPVALVKNMD
jgi:hypothetical protein